MEKSLIQNTGLRHEIRRAGVLVALFCIAATAMAQIESPMSWRHTEKFPKLPPLECDFNIDRLTHAQPNLLTIHLDNPQNQDATDNQSIMIRRSENKAMPHFNIKARPNIQGDAMKDLRERIVRERRFDEGRPLPPPPPRMMR